MQTIHSTQNHLCLQTSLHPTSVQAIIEGQVSPSRRIAWNVTHIRWTVFCLVRHECHTVIKGHAASQKLVETFLQNVRPVDLINEKQSAESRR